MNKKEIQPVVKLRQEIIKISINVNMKSPIITLPYRNALNKTLEELWVLNLGTFRFQSSAR